MALWLPLCTLLAVASAFQGRLLPQWFDEAKIGLFMHWGLYSVPAYGNEWYWHNLCSCSNHKGKPGCPNTTSAEGGANALAESLCDFHDRVYGPRFSYADFAPMFKVELFDAEHWADIFVKSGARYVVPTAKHHDGYCLWSSNVSWNWNAVDTGPERDLIQTIAETVHNYTNLTFGVYFSTFDWFHPLYMEDKANNGKTQNYVNEVMWPQFKDLVARFHPSFIRMDGSWEMTTEYWRAAELLNWLYTESPVKDEVVVTDSWGSDNCIHMETPNCSCKYGDSWTCGDHFTPGRILTQHHKWEHDTTITKNSWGYDRLEKANDYKTLDEILNELIPTIAFGGNFLINIGPTHDGRIIPEFEDRLTKMGDWLRVNGEAIYGSKPWTKNQNESSNIFYTSKQQIIYAIIIGWPENNVVTLTAPIPGNSAEVHMLGYPTAIKWSIAPGGKGVTVQFPHLSIADLPCEIAWTLKLENFS